MELAERIRREAEFHDCMEQHDTRGARFREWGLSLPALNHASAALGDLTGKLVLECGCGDGAMTSRFLRPGCIWVASDVSLEAVRRAEGTLNSAAAEAGARVGCGLMACEQLGIRDSSIDVAFGVSVLHHVDLPCALAEVRRVLRPGGRAIFVEPLRNHPLATIYRRFTPSRRSPDERPLNQADLGRAAGGFAALHQREFGLLSPFAVVFACLRCRPAFDALLKWLSRVDDFLFRAVPALRRFSWLTVIELKK